MIPIEIRFLGTGSGIPTLKRGQPSILIIYNGEYLLFDCGENCQIGLQKIKVSPLKINNIFISHWHADHFAGLLPLIETMHLLNRSKPLYVYGPDASAFIEEMMELSYWGTGFELIGKDVSGFEKILSAENYEIFSIPVKHSVPSSGYIFKEKGKWNINMEKARKFGLKRGELQKLKKDGKLVGRKVIRLADVADFTEGRKIIYSGDTEVCESLFREAFGSVVIHDSTFLENGKHSHASAIEVANLAKKYKVKKLILTHFSRRYEDMSEFRKVVKSIFKNVVIARDGMRVKV